MQYRRAFVAEGSYFFTVVTACRQKLFVDEGTVEMVREAFRHVTEKRPFTVNAMVVLPDHLHCIWTLAPADKDYSTRWRLIKTWAAKHYKDCAGNHALHLPTPTFPEAHPWRCDFLS